MPGHQRLSQTSESSQYRIHQASPTRQSPDLFNSAVLLIHPTQTEKRSLPYMKLIVSCNKERVLRNKHRLAFSCLVTSINISEKANRSEHQKATLWWLFGSRLRGPLIQRHAEFLAQDGFDPFEIFFHEGELFLNVCKPLQELVDSFGQFIQTLGKAFFRLRQAFVDGGQDSDFLCDELLLHPFVLSGKALFNPFVLSGEFLIHRLQNNGCLLHQQFFRSEERRVGKECRSWWPSYPGKKEM